jgi:hypothetical protein
MQKAHSRNSGLSQALPALIAMHPSAHLPAPDAKAASHAPASHPSRMKIDSFRHRHRLLALDCDIDSDTKQLAIVLFSMQPLTRLYRTR